MNKIKNFIELTRAYALLMTFASCAIVYAWVYSSEKYSLWNFFLLVLGLSLVHLGGNLFDDFIDIKRKLKDGIRLEDINFERFVNKARLIKDGTYSMRQVGWILALLFGVALSIGIHFVLFSGLKVICFIVAGGILTLIYPISSKFYMSEIIIGLLYGPLAIMGGYYALTSSFNSSLLLLSFAIFFTTVVLLHTDNIMDWEFDIKENKKTLAIVTGSKKRAISALCIMMGLAYLIVVYGVLTGTFNPKMLYVFLTLPVATKLRESITDYINVKDVQFKPRWYWGFFENWKSIQENKLDFFFFRFYLARNFAFFFALFAGIGALLG